MLLTNTVSHSKGDFAQNVFFVPSPEIAVKAVLWTDFQILLLSKLKGLSIVENIIAEENADANVLFGSEQFCQAEPVCDYNNRPSQLRFNILRFRNRMVPRYICIILNWNYRAVKGER